MIAKVSDKEIRSALPELVRVDVRLVKTSSPPSYAPEFDAEGALPLEA
jgi:hypothetical protein